MRIIDTPIADLLVIEPKVWKDDRGYFYESFRETNEDQPIPLHVAVRSCVLQSQAIPPCSASWGKSQPQIM